MIIAVDFDGTLALDEYPGIGEQTDEMRILTTLLRQAQYEKHSVILDTCRAGDRLQEAVLWLKNTAHFSPDFVNENVPERIEQFGGDTRKISADLYIEDSAAGFTFEGAFAALCEALRVLPASTPQSILQEAHGLVYGDRAAQHGDIHVTFPEIAERWSLELGKTIRAYQVARCMAEVKAVRQRYGEYDRDDYTDQVGYLEIACRLKEGEQCHQATR